MADDEGLALIEVLVALVIIGLVGVAVYDIVAGATSRQAAAASRTLALVQARSALAKLLPQDVAALGTVTILLADGTRWTVLVEANPDSQLLRTLSVRPTGTRLQEPVLVTWRYVEAAP